MDETCSIQEKLTSVPKRTVSEDYVAEAAVLMPLYRRRGRLHLLLTRRTQQVSTHKGDVSFPGGLREDGDTSLSETALRETHEEVGIDPSYVRILGPFHQYLAISNVSVTPFVGFLQKGFPLRPSRKEVAAVLQVPLEFFAETVPTVEKRWRSGRTRRIYFYNFEGEVIWGLTARIIKDFVDSIVV